MSIRALTLPIRRDQPVPSLGGFAWRSPLEPATGRSYGAVLLDEE